TKEKYRWKSCLSLAINVIQFQVTINPYPIPLIPIYLHTYIPIHIYTATPTISMLTKRIIPCLDIKDGRTVKGVNFVNIRDAGDPVELGASYANQGADELVFLDISATDEQRKTFAHLVKDIALHINIPFTVGGGISSVADVAPLLESGADKVSVNSSAVRNPALIDELVHAFGSQCIVLAIDAKKIANTWTVYTHGGKKPSEKRLFSWAKEGQ